MLKLKYANSEKKCPHCGHTHIVLFGKSRGKQRYLCRGCGRTFNDFTNTPFAMTHFPDKWESFIKCMINGMSLRVAGKKIKVSYVTLFYWRHKILCALNKIQPGKMNGNVEMSNLFLKYSEKGKKQSVDKEKRVHNKSRCFVNINNDMINVLTAIDLSGNTFFKAVCTGHLHTNDLENTIGKIVNEDNIVCSKPKNLFTMFLRKMRIPELSKNLNNDNIVIKYMNDFINWMMIFKGVASKYLNNYLSLYKFLNNISFDESLRGIEDMLSAVCAISVKNTYLSIGKLTLFENG